MFIIVLELARFALGCAPYGFKGNAFRALAFGIPAAYLWLDNTFMLVGAGILLTAFIGDLWDIRKNSTTGTSRRLK